MATVQPVEKEREDGRTKVSQIGSNWTGVYSLGEVPNKTMTLPTLQWTTDANMSFPVTSHEMEKVTSL